MKIHKVRKWSLKSHRWKMHHKKHGRVINRQLVIAFSLTALNFATYSVQQACNCKIQLLVVRPGPIR
jgi:hypothetical protein